MSDYEDYDYRDYSGYDYDDYDPGYDYDPYDDYDDDRDDYDDYPDYNDYPDYDEPDYDEPDYDEPDYDEPDHDEDDHDEDDRQAELDDLISYLSRLRIGQEYRRYGYYRCPGCSKTWQSAQTFCIYKGTGDEKDEKDKVIKRGEGIFEVRNKINTGKLSVKAGMFCFAVSSYRFLPNIFLIFKLCWRPVK